MLKKSDRVMFEGKVATCGFRNREVNDRTVTEIVVSRRQDTVSILSNRRADGDVASDSPESRSAASNAGMEASSGGSKAGRATAALPTCQARAAARACSLHRFGLAKRGLA